MLPLRERLKRTNLFTRAYGLRKQINTPIFTLYVLPRNAPIKRDLPKVGFVVSKKICKRACRRNRMKRRLREAYRKLAGSMQTHKWYAMVLVIKESALNTPWSEICSTMENAFLEAARRYG